MKLARNVRPPVRPMWAMLAICGLAIATPIGLVGARGGCCAPSISQVELAKIQVDKLRTSTTQWVLQHLDGRCPRIQDLDPEATDDDRTDPWGHPVMIACDADGHVLTRSRGPDGIAGSDDDVVSR